MRASVIAALLAPALLATASLAAGERVPTLRAATVAALTPPMIAFRLRDAAGRPLAARDAALAGDDLPVLAVLDTGASAHLLSHDTAARLGVRADAGARWIEIGMAGEHPLAVSAPYTLVLDVAGADGQEHARRGAPARAPAPLMLSAQRLLLNDVATTPAAILTSPGAIVDVVGMPALARAVAELAPAPDALGAMAVTLRPASDDVHADLWTPLALVDFSRRRHPANRGAPPTLAANPLIRGVEAVRGAARVRGDWLVDTGSAVTIVSTAGARALALHEPAPLAAPIGGIAGAARALPGWRLDRLELPTTTGTLALTDVAVFAHDVTTTADDGTRTTLDGILGVNALEAFARVVVDVPRARLGFDLDDAGARARH